MKERFVRAAGWMLLGHVLTQLIRLGSNLILTRLLAPELYGVMAVGYVVMTGIGLFSDVGLNSVGIRGTRGDEPTFLNVGWAVQISRGVLIMFAALVAALAMQLASSHGWFPPHSTYADPRVPLLIAVVSIDGLISGFESTKVWFCRRHLLLGALTKIEIGGQAATTAFILAWAYFSPTIWALVAGWLFGALFRTVMTHAMLPGPANRFEWDRATFLEIWHYGKWVFVSSALTFLASNGDRLMLGAMLNSTMTGLYSVAQLLIGAVKSVVGRVVGDAVLPALSEVFRDRPNELRHTMYRIRRPLDALCMLSAGALFALGQTIVDILYDSRYTEAGWMLSVSALSLVSIRVDVFDQCLIAIGRVKLLSLLNSIRLVVLYVAVPLGYLLYGSTGAVVGVTASALAGAMIVLVFQARLGLLEVRRELLAIPLFVAGLTIGWLASLPFHRHI